MDGIECQNISRLKADDSDKETLARQLPLFVFLHTHISEAYSKP
jgi:hypothetical protein